MLLLNVLWLDDTLPLSATIILMENYEKCHHFEVEKKKHDISKIC